MRLGACDMLTRLTLEKASTRMGDRGRAAHGVSARRSVDQRFRPARTRHNDLLVRSPHYPYNTMLVVTSTADVVNLP